MKIVMFSINPLFADQVMGGAPKHLQAIAIHLGELGHDVLILCTESAGSRKPFYWHERILVRPILRFKQPFPQPYDTPAYNLAAALQDMGDALADAGRFYMHDGEFLFPYVYSHIPTIVSLRDSVYPETQLGAFLFQGDALIAISEHSRQYYLRTAGRFFPGLAERTIVIYNGLDWERFRPTPVRKILELIPVDPATDSIILHPHRPEPSKGLRQTIAVVDLLVNRYRLPRLRVLVPRWLDGGQSAEVRAFYEAIKQEIAERGLADNFVFHDWIPQNLMPEYYSLGTVTFSLGHFVESFGNAVYESLGCGTPAIVARVATHRELVPDDLLDKVHFGDMETAAALAAAIIREKRRTASATLAYLHNRYGIERQLREYADVILNASKRGLPVYRRASLGPETRWTLAPWCYRWEGGIYHDYLAEHKTLPKLESLIGLFPQGFTIDEARIRGIRPESVEDWFRAGFIVPS